MKVKGILAISLGVAALLAGCGNQATPAQNVDVAKLRGQAIKELPKPEPTVTETIKTTVMTKPNMDTRAGVTPSGIVSGSSTVQRGESGQQQAASEKPFIEELPKSKQVQEVPAPPAVAKPQIIETGSVPVVSQTGEESPKPVQQPKAGKPPAPPVELVPLGKIGEYTVVGFDRLASFAYEVPDDPITEPKAKAIIEKNVIPKTVRVFDKKKVALKGYMLPLKVEDGKITELLILRDQSMCCYGAVPKINEWVSVRMPKGKGVKPVMDVPITIFGTLKVGEVLENGYLVGIYEMDGDRLGGPIDL